MQNHVTTQVYPVTFNWEGAEADLSQAAEATGPTILLSVNRNFRGKVKDKSLWEQHTTSFRRELLDAHGIAAAISTGYSIASDHHTRRCRANFVSAQFIGLDFDTEDERSALGTLLNDDFIRRHGTIVHTTSSHTDNKPRSRVIFLLDQQVIEPGQFVEYAQALNWKYGCTDSSCTDPTRCWFGAEGCRIVVRPDRILPLAVLDQLVAQYRQAHQPQVSSNGTAISIDLQQELERAIVRAAVGTRNQIGFQWACLLRDNGLSQEQALPLMFQYQAAVCDGPHPYTEQEARASLASAYSRPPRRMDIATLKRIARLIEYGAWNHGLGLKQGALHYSLKTLYGVVDIALKAGRIHNLALPVRDFNDYGVPKATASNHLKSMCDSGILILRKPGKGPRASEYDINLPYLYQVAVEWLDGAMPLLDTLARERDCNECPTMAQLPTISIEQGECYRQLQHLPHFWHGAAIDPRLWPIELSEWSLGPVAQRLVATMATGEVSSKSDLFRKSGVSPRTGNRKLKLLEELGIITYHLNPDNESARVPSLVEDWYERLQGMEWALNTYGHNVLQAERCDMQRIAYHRSQTPESAADKAVSVRAVERAEQRLEGYERRKQELLGVRRTKAAAMGITDVPGLALRPRRAGSGRRRQPVGVAKAGRYVIPPARRFRYQPH